MNDRFETRVREDRIESDWEPLSRALANTCTSRQIRFDFQTSLYCRDDYCNSPDCMSFLVRSHNSALVQM